MKIRSASALSSLVAFLAAVQPARSEDAPLQAFRKHAAALAKNPGPAGKADKAYCEYALSRPTDACSGDDRVEESIRISADGNVTLFRARSFSESESPSPGQFRGKVGAGKWKGLMAAFAKMDWVAVPAGLPMPMPSEDHRRLTLGDGREKTEYSFAGSIPIGQDLIADGFGAPGDLADSAKDTLWALSLAVSVARWKNGMLDVDAEWRLAGSTSVSVSLPAQGSECGSATLTWFEDEPETPGVTSLPPDLQTAALAKPPAGSGSLRALVPGKPEKVTLRFAVPKQKSFPRKGKLTHLGLTVRLKGSASPMRVTLFSPLFKF